MATTTTARPMFVGVDATGDIAEVDGFRYYLTPCCWASATGTADYVGCRACYEPVDPRLGGIVPPEHTWRRRLAAPLPL